MRSCFGIVVLGLLGLAAGLSVVRAAETPAAAPVAAAAQGGAIEAINPPEKDFFSKKLMYHEIPIKAHKDVSDAALREAWKRLEMELGKQPNVRTNLKTAGAELHIIGKDQVTSDLPENLHMKGKPFDGKQTVDQRTRGLGGLLTSCGEENLLKLEKDPYRGRDICLHEFAHNIFQVGVPSEFREKVGAQRKASLEKGLWVRSYAGSNDHEFFAELTMWYFGTHGDMGMTGKKPANGPEGLKAYDPEAYKILDDFYSGRTEIPVIERGARRKK